MGETETIDRELKKGSAELLVLAQIEVRARHGYEIGRRIESASEGRVRFHIASLYPLLYRLEKRGWIEGRWVEKPGERRKRFYRITPAGRRALAAQRRSWLELTRAIASVAGVEGA